MTVMTPPLVAYQVAAPLAIVSLVMWVIVYTKLQPWWRDSIGITLVTKTLIITLLLGFFTLGLFWDLSRETSAWFAWAELALLFAITPVMAWRTWVWAQTSVEAAARVDLAESLQAEITALRDEVSRLLIEVQELKTQA